MASCFFTKRFSFLVLGSQNLFRKTGHLGQIRSAYLYGLLRFKFAMVYSKGGGYEPEEILSLSEDDSIKLIYLRHPERPM